MTELPPSMSRSPNDHPATADVVIIGGGPSATGALWALNRAQPGLRCVLIERAPQLGSGASNASLENFRTAWNAPCNVELMRRSVEVFLNPGEYFGDGIDLGVRQRGYVWCAFSDQQARKLQSDVAHLHDIGLNHILYLEADEVAYRFPWLGPAVLAAKVDPHAGWLDSYALIQAMARSAPRATILCDVPHVSVETARGRVTGVRTPGGFIAAPRVLIACGADARLVGRTAGVELPVVMRPRQSLTTHWRHPEYPADGPMIIGGPPYPHVRPEAQSGAIFGWEYAWINKRDRDEHGRALRDLVEPVYPADVWKDPRFPSMVLTVFSRQFGHTRGGFASPGYLRGLDHRAGYYVYRDESAAHEALSDGSRRHYESQRAIIDAHPAVEGLYVSIAHVGHGIMSSPAAGEIAAARILNQPLPHPAYADFGIDVPHVEWDSSGLAADEAVVRRSPSEQRT